MYKNLAATPVEACFPFPLSPAFSQSPASAKAPLNIGNVDVAHDAPLSAIPHQWGGHCTRRAQPALDGRWKGDALWGGVKAGMICVDSLRAKMPLAVANEMLAAGKVLSDAQILRMNFLVQGVQGRRAKTAGNLS